MVPRRSLTWLAFALALQPCAPAGAQQAAEIKVDVTRLAQPIVGFGMEIWLRDRAVFDILKDFDIDFVRLSVLPNLKDSSLPEGLGRQQMRATVRELLGRNDQGASRRVITESFEKLRSAHVKPLVVLWAAPHNWENPKGALREERIGDLARLWGATLLELKELSAVPAYIELINEPHGRWATHINPKEYARVVVAVRRELDELGFKEVKIAGPGVAAHRAAEWIGAMDAEAVRAIGAWSAHYYERETGDQHAPEQFAQAARRASRAEILLTEFSTKESAFPGARYADNKDTSAQPTSKASYSHEYALRVYQNILAHINVGIGGMSYWEAMDHSWAKAHWGALDLHGARKPVYLSLEALMPHIPNDARALGRSWSDDALTIAAVKSPRQVVVGIANESSTLQKRTLSLAGKQCRPQQVKGVRYARAGLSQVDLAPGPSIAVEIPPSSALTVVIDAPDC